MTVETLDARDREYLADCLHRDRGHKALRIIDAQAAALAELTVFAGTQTDECARLRKRVEIEVNTRADWRASVDARVQELEEQNERLVSNSLKEAGRFHMACDARDSSEAKARRLEAENERLQQPFWLRADRADPATLSQSELCEEFTLTCAALTAAESRLATAVGLLRTCEGCLHPAGPLIHTVHAFLANQPAAPRGDVLSDGTWIRTPEEEGGQPAAPTRAEAES